MNAGSEGGREHPVAVLEPDPKVWMTMTEPKAAQAVATTSEPRRRANAIDQATISSLYALERELGRLTWCKQVMVWTFKSSNRAPTDEAPKTEDADTESTHLKASTGAGCDTPKRFLSVQVRCFQDLDLESVAQGSWIHFS
jgi:hypothetical protein